MKSTASELIAELKNGERKNIILDTDAYNEVDDQYTIAYAMLSPDRVNILSINAAPFLNRRNGEELPRDIPHHRSYRSRSGKKDTRLPRIGAFSAVKDRICALRGVRQHRPHGNGEQ